MSPPLQDAASGSGLNFIPAESRPRELNLTGFIDEGLGLSHQDPTFQAVARRLDWGEGDWTLRGPAFEDGTYPIIRLEWRLGEIIFKLLSRHSRINLSRSQKKAIERGEPLKSIRFTKETTPTAVEFGDMNSSRGSTKNTPTERGISNV